MNKNKYKDELIVSECLREFIVTCHDSEKIKVCRNHIRSLTKSHPFGFITKSAMADIYGIDRRTFNKRMVNLLCIGEIAQQYDNYVYENVKIFSPADCQIIYARLGQPPPLK